MAAVLQFVFFIVDSLLGLLILALLIYAVMSWLIVFDVINTRNRFVYSVVQFLESVTRPVLAPFRRFIPPLGGVDISFIIAFLVLQGVRSYLLRPLFYSLTNAVG